MELICSPISQDAKRGRLRRAEPEHGEVLEHPTILEAPRRADDVETGRGGAGRRLRSRRRHSPRPATMAAGGLPVHAGSGRVRQDHQTRPVRERQRQAGVLDGGYRLGRV